MKSPDLDLDETFDFTCFNNPYLDIHYDMVHNSGIQPLRSTQCTVYVEKTQTRNERCECGSGLKFKKCCINKKTDSI